MGYPVIGSCVMKIHQVKGRFVNSYVVEEGGRMFVVDIGLRGERRIISYIMNILENDPLNVDLVVCTHDDPDHSYGLPALARRCRAKVGYPYASHSVIRKLWHDPAGIYFRLLTAVEEAFHPRMWRMYFNPGRWRGSRNNLAPKRTRTPPRLAHLKIFPDFRIKNNESLHGFDDWILVHTPGHSWDSCCYFHVPTRSLIAGDTLLGSARKGRVVLPAIYSNPRQMARSVAKLKTLNPASVYPGHGSCFHGDRLLDHI